MAYSDKDIVITPNKGSSTDDPKINFTGGSASGVSTISVNVYDVDNGTLSFDGTAGQLFSITNNLTSGSIFSVNDISGIPSIDVNADGTVQLAPFGSTELVGIGTTNPTQKLDVNGNIRLRSGLYDNNNGSGSSGQVLTSTGSGIEWATATGVGMGRNILTQEASTPYYITASKITSGVSTSGFINSTVVIKDGQIGIGTTNPTEKIELFGNVKLSQDLLVGTGRTFVVTTSTATTSYISARSGIITTTEQFLLVPSIDNLNNFPNDQLPGDDFDFTGNFTTGQLVFPITGADSTSLNTILNDANYAGPAINSGRYYLIPLDEDARDLFGGRINRITSFDSINDTLTLESPSLVTDNDLDPSFALVYSTLAEVPSGEANFVGIGTDIPLYPLHVDPGPALRNTEFPALFVDGSAYIKGGLLRVGESSITLDANTNGAEKLSFSRGNSIGIHSQSNNSIAASGSLAAESVIESVGLGTNNFVSYNVTVGVKTTGDVHLGTGSTEKFVIEGNRTPYLHLTAGRTYSIKQDNASNLNHTLKFYNDLNQTTEVSGVTTVGTAGSEGAYTELSVHSVTTPSRIYYGSIGTSHVGNMAMVEATSNHANSGLVTFSSISAGIITATNLYVNGSEVTGGGGIATAVAVTLDSTTASAYKIPYLNTTSSSSGDYELLLESGTFTYQPSNNTLTVNGISVAQISVSDYISLSDNDVIRIGSSNDAKVFYDGTANDLEIELEASANKIAITDNGTYRHLITRDGKVGINTSVTPTVELNVVGDANITGVITATSFVGDGSGLTNLPSSGGGGDGADFNTGLSTTKYHSAANDIDGYTAIGVTIPSTSGKTYLVPSIHITNVSNGDLYITSRIDYSGGENVPLTNKVIVPYQGALEIIDESLILNPSDNLRFAAFAGTGPDAAGVINGLDCWVSYEEKDDTNYIGTGSTIVNTIGDVGYAQTVFTSTTNPSVINTIVLTNYSDVSDVDVSVSIYRNGTIQQGYLAYNLTVPQNSSVQILPRSKRLNASDTIVVNAAVPNIVGVNIAGKYIV